jgi:hypothetical protein
MARIRSIKPELPQSESMGKVGRDARLCFVLMWTMADDSGRLRGNSRMLASLLFPYDDDAPALIDGWLQELEREDCVVRYAAGGSTYIQITNWLSHQKIDKPTPSKIPPFVESSRILANPRESSCEERKGGEGTKDGIKEGMPHDKSRSSAKRSTPSEVGLALADGVDPTHLNDWIKARKSPLTATAWEGLKTEAEKAGITPAEAVRICAVRGWRGFDSTWNWRSASQGTPTSAADQRDAEAMKLLGFGQGDFIDA